MLLHNQGSIYCECCIYFFKQKTAYEMRISDWSSDVCSSDLLIAERVATCDLMMALVSAGFALGLAGAAHIATSRELGVVARPLASRVPPLTTYLLRLDGDPSDELRSEERRVGKGCVSKCRSRWSQYH